MQELQSLLAGRICTATQQHKCQEEDQEFAKWACNHCQDYVRPEQISPWSRHLFLLHQLKEAGYPFQANDLSLEVWMMLGQVKRLAQRYRPPVKSRQAVARQERELW
jgi:lipopolysaccharide biosynthesis regulator YciM